MGDPFEDAASQAKSPAPSSQGAPHAPNGALHPTASQAAQLREPFVQQAVNFLNDPRVKAADRSRAVTFLRGKGVTDGEIWEAFQRCGMSYPANVHPGSMPMHGPNTTGLPMAVTYDGRPHQVGLPLPRAEVPATRRPSWVSMLLGLTAAAGLYTAVREVLRQYVVPLYFPDAARAAEERGRRESEDAASQRREISELRERVQDLCASSARTSERVEQLSRSISSSLAIRERELSTTAELRDAIRQLSHSVSMSASIGTDAVAFADDSGQPMSAASTRKAGNLAYTATRRLPAAGKPPSYDDSRRDAAAYEDVPNGNVEEDDFMSMAPAQVEDSWRADVRRTSMTRDSTTKPVFSEEIEDVELTRTMTTTQVMGRRVIPFPVSGDEGPHATRRSMSSARIDERPHGSDDEHAARNETIVSQESSDIRERVDMSQGDEIDTVIVADAMAVANGDISTDVTVEASSEVDENTGNSSPSGTADDNDRVDESGLEQPKNRIMAARKMFESDVLAEASHLFGEGGISGSLKKDNRPTSMPVLDPPLSDLDY